MSGVAAPAQPSAITPGECRQSINGTVALTDRINAIGQCRRPEENTRMNNFLNETYKLRDLFTNEDSIYNDLISTGDRLFGSAASSNQITDIQRRNQELIDLKNKLIKENNSLKGIAEQNKRDFVDEKIELPEPLPNKVLHTLEDYTIGVFLMAYVFMVIALIYYYSAINMFTLKSIGFSIFLSVVVSLILFVLLYNVL
jgi:hypothetical protein